MLITVIVFSLLVVGIALLLLLRRIIVGRLLGRRLRKIDEWGGLLDGIIARMDSPLPAEISELSFKGRFNRRVLEEVLLERMDLMAGNSRIPLIEVYRETGLLDMVLKELKSGKVGTRRRAADNLGRGASRDMAPHLLKSLDDPDVIVRSIAAKSLGKLGIQTAAPRMVTLFPELPEDICIVIASALIDLGASTLEPLAEALVHESEKVRYFAALVVGHICEEGRCRLEVMKAMPCRRATDVSARYPPVLNERLRLLTHDESNRVRIAAIEALASLQDTDAAPRLEEMLQQESGARIRAAAAKALAETGTAHSVYPLIGALDDHVWEVARAASRSLVALGPPAIERLAAPGMDSPGIEKWRPEIMELAGRATR